MSTITQSPSPNKPISATCLVYVPSQSFFDGETYWRLYTADGIRFTPDVLTTEELMAKERRIRDVSYPRLPLSFRYFMPERI